MAARKRKKKRKKKWLGKARASMKKRGTIGSFTAICVRWGYKGVTDECIQRALKSKSPSVRKKAGFAKSVRKFSKKKKRRK